MREIVREDGGKRKKSNLTVRFLLFWTLFGLPNSVQTSRVCLVYQKFQDGYRRDFQKKRQKAGRTRDQIRQRWKHSAPMPANASVRRSS